MDFYIIGTPSININLFRSVGAREDSFESGVDCPVCRLQGGEAIFKAMFLYFPVGRRQGTNSENDLSALSGRSAPGGLMMICR